MRAHRRGFALITVVLVTALGAIAAATLLDVVTVDILLGHTQRQTQTAREIAEGGVMEVINDVDTPAQLPMFDDATMTARYTPAANTAFGDTRGRYTAEMALVRIAPLAESSALQARALVYEVSAVGAAAEGGAQFDVRAEVYRVVAYKPGTVLPRRHAR